MVSGGSSYSPNQYGSTYYSNKLVYSLVDFNWIDWWFVLNLQLFEFGDRFRGKYDKSVEIVKGYYPSVSGYMDELLWAALWLYKATDNERYLDYVIRNGDSFGGTTWSITEFSWDVKYAGVQLFASMVCVISFHKLRSWLGCIDYVYV